MLLNIKKISKQLFLILFIIGFTKANLIAGQSVIIGFNDKPGKKEKNLIEKNGGTIKYEYTLLPAFAANIPKQNIKSLQRNPLVAYIEEDKSVSGIDRDFTTIIEKPLKLNRAYKKTKFHNLESLNRIQTRDVNLSNDEYERNWGIQHIKAKIAHDKNITAKGIKIAILDTGIDYTHEDLKDNYKGGYNYIKNDRNSSDPFDDGWNMHGTHIAGIIAAKANKIGVVGVAPDASLYALKVLDAGGFGLVSDIVSAIEWSVENKMDIANISITGIDSKILKDACDAAKRAGLLIVAAAGNTYGEAALFPASYDSVIAVNSIDDNDTLSFFSAVDPAIEIAAPGLNILSTTGNNDYAALSGTSQSAAFISGAAALIMSSGLEDINQDGEINNLDVREKLQTAVKDLGEEGRDDKYGFGLISIDKAISTANESDEEESCDDEYQYTYDEGWNSGYDPGFEEGKNDALANKAYRIDSHFDDDGEFDDGWRDGYTYGYEQGWKSIKNPEQISEYLYTYDEGWDSGYDPGFEEGRNDACNNKAYRIDSHFDDDGEFDYGWKDGYTYGYEQGWQSCSQD